jgi:hypothetical protein
MAISQKRYIDITSGVGGSAAAGQRELICRVMTTNTLANTQPVLEFTSIENVATVFPTTSDEYKFAAKYFGFVSKSITMPKKISFAFYGANEETPAEAMQRTANDSNNFGSFVFIEELTPVEISAVAEWVNTTNVQFLYSVPVTSSNYSNIQPIVAGKNGVWLQLDDGDYAEYMPCAILASTNYNRINAAQTFMFQQFPSAVATVTTDTLADTYDAVKVNYYGATQSAGQQLAFLQRGVLQGSIEDAGVYCNEMWLKDAIIVAGFNLFLAVGKVPANLKGNAMISGVMIDIFELALQNGTFSPEKNLTSTQKAYIENLTNDADAWQSVFNNGYYFKGSIDPVTQNGQTNYVFNYILIYSKGDAVKKIEGSDILI